jgi:MFS family permease
MLFWLYAGCGVVLGLLSLRLGPEVEAAPPVATSPQTSTAEGPTARGQERKEPAQTGTFAHRALGLGSAHAVVLRLSALFALDSFGGGFCVQSFLAWWFHQKFGVSDAALGTVFFGTNLLSGFSALVAVPLARRFGLIATMVWTHLPSSVLLMAVPLMPTATAAMVMLWLRNAISQMDVPTRGSYVNAVVPPENRAAANGVTTTAKQIGSSISPLLAAPLLASAGWLSVPFWICGATKIVYDLLLWRAFRHVRPPEEVGRSFSRNRQS